jgi:hypothetical protein
MTNLQLQGLEGADSSEITRSQDTHGKIITTLRNVSAPFIAAIAVALSGCAAELPVPAQTADNSKPDTSKSNTLTIIHPWIIEDTIPPTSVAPVAKVAPNSDDPWAGKPGVKPKDLTPPNPKLLEQVVQPKWQGPVPPRSAPLKAGLPFTEESEDKWEPLKVDKK